jgi:hypothetical protein
VLGIFPAAPTYPPGPHGTRQRATPASAYILAFYAVARSMDHRGSPNTRELSKIWVPIAEFTDDLLEVTPNSHTTTTFCLFYPCARPWRRRGAQEAHGAPSQRSASSSS